MSNQLSSKGRDRIVKQLDQMVKSGHVTEAEAKKLRGAATAREFGDAVQSIRVRHAAAKLRAAVESGHMTQEEVAAYMERLEKGEHPKSHRPHVRRMH